VREDQIHQAKKVTLTLIIFYKHQEKHLGFHLMLSADLPGIFWAGQRSNIEA